MQLIYRDISMTNMDLTVPIILVMLFQFGIAAKLTTKVDATDESDYIIEDGDEFREFDPDTEEKSQPITWEPEVSSDNKQKKEYSDIIELIKQGIIVNNEKKMLCYVKDNGLFWDGNKGTCESCDKHCREENLKNCAFQCKAYLVAKKESEDLELRSISLENDIKSANTNITIITIVAAVSFVSLLIVCASLYWKQHERFKSLELKYQQALPEGDKHDVINRETVPILKTATQEGGA